MPPPARKLPATRSVAARLFGYDVFISFALSGAGRGSRAYAADLARRLRELDFTVFFSEDEAPAGAQLDAALRGALHSSRTLVVIANRGTLKDPRWVRKEVEEFRRRHPRRPVIPINIDGALQDVAATDDAPVWLEHAGRIWIDETADAAAQGACSDDVVRRLATAPSAARSSTRLRGLLAGTFLMLSTLAAVAFWQADAARKEARAARAALSSQLATHAQLALPASPARGLLLALAALDVTSTHGEPRVPAAEETLRAALTQAGGAVQARLQEPATAVELDRTGRWLAVATGSGRGARLRDLQNPTSTDVDLSPASSVVFSDDGRWLVAGAAEGGPARLWSLGEKAVATRTLDQAIAPFVFAADGQWLASGGAAGSMRLWRLDDPSANARVLFTFPNDRLTMARSRDDHWLVAGSWSERGELGAARGAAILCDMTGPLPCASPRVLAAGRASLNHFAFTADGRWLAASSSERVSRPWRMDPDVRLFDLAKPDLTPLLLQGHTGPVAALAVSDDSTLLASGASEGSIRIWNLASDAPASNPLVLPEQDQDIAALAFDSRQSRLFTLTGGTKNAVDRGPPTAAVWPLDRLMQAAREPSTRTAGLPDQDLRQALLQDQGQLVSVSAHRFDTSRHRILLSSDATLQWIDLDDSDPFASARRFRGHEHGVQTLAVSSDLLASGGDEHDRTVRTWDLARAADVASPLAATHGDGMGAMSVDGRWFLTKKGRPDPAGGGDLAATLWDLSSSRAVGHRLGGHAGAVHAARLSPDGRWAATADHAGVVRLWRLTGASVATSPIELRGHGEAVHDLAFTHDGRWLASASSDKTVRLWDLASSRPDAGARVLQATSSVFRVDIVGDRWLVGAGLAPAAPRRWDLRAADIAGSGRDVPGAAGFVQVSASGRWLLATRRGSADRSAALWSVDDLEASAQGVDAQGQSLAFSPSGRWLTSRGRNRPCRLWSLDGPAPVAVAWPEGTPPPPTEVAWSGDEKALFGAAPDGSVHRWEIGDGHAVYKSLLWPGVASDGQNAVESLAASTQGDLLFLGGKVPRLLSLAGRDAMSAIRLPTVLGEVGSAAFSADGRFIVTRGPSYALHLWHLRLDELVRVACATAGRDVDDEERTMFGIDPAHAGVCKTDASGHRPRS